MGRPLCGRFAGPSVPAGARRSTCADRSFGTVMGKRGCSGCGVEKVEPTSEKPPSRPEKRHSRLRVLGAGAETGRRGGGGLGRRDCDGGGHGREFWSACWREIITGGDFRSGAGFRVPRRPVGRIPSNVSVEVARWWCMVAGTVRERLPGALKSAVSARTSALSAKVVIEAGPTY